MKAVLLAGGLGSRIAEESQLRPKPMIEIGGRPILWHIMKIYAHHGVTDFIVCLGYKSYMVKEFFANYVLHSSDVTIDAKNNKIIHHHSTAEPWTVTLVDTGEATNTGGRVRRIARYLEGQPFCLTYGDGVADIDIRALLDFHKSHGKLATLTAVVPPGRYGALDLDGSKVSRFIEKPPGDNAFINGGFFVLEPGVIEQIEGDHSSFESDTLTKLAQTGQLMAFRHTGFWQAMDTLRDKNALETYWQSGAAPWKIWP
jgi:glucose-1-phosphate cytidylyltransferase